MVLEDSNGEFGHDYSPDQLIDYLQDKWTIAGSVWNLVSLIKDSYVSKPEGDLYPIYIFLGYKLVPKLEGSMTFEEAEKYTLTRWSDN